MKASDILGLDDLKTKVVKVDQWDMDVTICELDLNQGMQLFGMISEINDDHPTITAEQVAQIVVWGIIDEESGKHVFSDSDIPKLVKKNRVPLMFLYQEISSLSGDDAEKN